MKKLKENYMILMMNFIFEGEYLSLNSLEIIGKLYNADGKLIFEGTYLDGEKNGEGKEYDNDGKIKYEGQYMNGKRWNGEGWEYYSNNKKYNYQYINGNYFMSRVIEPNDIILNGGYYESGIIKGTKIEDEGKKK